MLEAVWSLLGRFHPIIVHFPVALVVTSALAEGLMIATREGRFGDAARFMVIVAAWASLAAGLAGFAAASGRVFEPELVEAFSTHRAAGIVTPVMTCLAAVMAVGARRSGQVWELMLFRVFLVLALIAVTVAGWEGGELVHGPIF